MLKAVAIAVGFIIFAQIAAADDAEKVVGTWKLLSFDLEFQNGSPNRAAYGSNPTGYVIFTAQGRMMGIMEGEGRKPASTDEERAASLRTMFAYTGTYRLEGDKWVTTVDVSWNPAWNGTDQVRFYKLDGDRLTVTSAWTPSVNLPGSPVTRGVLLFDRVK